MHLTMHDDPGVWADLKTADYDTGISSTDEFTQDGPEAPMGLTITSFPQMIRFSVALPAYFAPGSVIELWEHTASTPFGSATKIAESRSSVIDLSKRDITSRFYWVRTRDQTGAVSGTFPTSLGQSGAADRVQTGDIGDNAATDVFEHVNAGPNTYPAAASTVYVPLIVVFDADADGAVQASATLDVSTSSPVIGPVVRMRKTFGQTITADANMLLDSNPRRLAFQLNAEMQQGEHIQVAIEIVNPSVDVTVSNGRLRVEAIKR